MSAPESSRKRGRSPAVEHESSKRQTVYTTLSNGYEKYDAIAPAIIRNRQSSDFPGWVDFGYHKAVIVCAAIPQGVPVNFSIDPSSQCASITFTELNRRNFGFRVYGADLKNAQRATHKSGFRGMAPSIPQTFDATTRFVNAIDFELAVDAKPIPIGYTDAELELDTDSTALKQAYQAIVASKSDFSLHVFHDTFVVGKSGRKSIIPMIEGRFDHWIQSMMLGAKFGTFWYFKNHTTFASDNGLMDNWFTTKKPDKISDLVDPPKWLLAKEGDKGWVSFAVQTTFRNIEDWAITMLLGLQRDAAFGAKLQNEMYDPGQGVHEAIFVPLELTLKRLGKKITEGQQCRVLVKLAKSFELSGGKKPMPQEGSMVHIQLNQILGAGTSTDSAKTQIRGLMVELEEHEEQIADVAFLVQDLPVSVKLNQWISLAEIKPVIDSKSVAAQMAAIRKVQPKYIAGPRCVDLNRLVLNQRAQEPDVTFDMREGLENTKPVDDAVAHWHEELDEHQYHTLQ